MTKLKKMNADKNITAKIPYLRVMPDENMVEVKQGYFTKIYSLGDIRPENVNKNEIDLFSEKIGQLLNCFGEDVTLQFMNFNKLTTEDNFFKKALLQERHTDAINRDIALYNAVVRENSEIGHNNIRQMKYFSIGVKRNIAEEAIEKFHEVESVLYQAFDVVYGTQVKEMNITEILHLLYDMYNPDEECFGKIINLPADQEIDFKVLQRLKLTTKDIVAPQKLNTATKLKNHIIFNDNTYARAFFINSIPAKIADNFIDDLTNLVGRMAYSVTLEPMDAAFGRDLAKDLVMDNTIVKTVKNRKTLEDKRNKTVIRTEETISNTEADYFNKVALEVCKEAAAKEQYMFAVTAVIIIYADDLEELNNNSDLLRVSASKFAVQVKSLDMQQLEGFQTALPLCNCKIDTKRILNTQRTVHLIPLNLNNITKSDGLYHGLNTFTDNLILLNRRNNPVLSGMITGAGSAGKTYQMKREIFHALAGTDDDVLVISAGNSLEYDDFIRRYGGTIVNQIDYDVFSDTEGYALNGNPVMFKKTFLKALYEIATNYTTDYMWQLKNNNLLDYEKRQQLIERIVTDSVQAKKQLSDIQFMNYMNKQDKEAQDAFTCKENMEPVANRLTLYNATNISDVMKLLDFCWVQAIENKKKNRDTWIFIDSMDEAFHYPHAMEYIRTMMQYCSIIGTIVTFVLQDPAEMAVADNYAFDGFVSELGYIKLLNQGARERQYFENLLNIPQILVKYISTAEYGQVGTGIILTDLNNIAFDDSFMHVTSEEMKAFHDIFAKKQDYNYMETLSNNREREGM